MRTRHLLWKEDFGVSPHRQIREVAVSRVPEPDGDKAAVLRCHPSAPAPQTLPAQSSFASCRASQPSARG